MQAEKYGGRIAYEPAQPAQGAAGLPSASPATPASVSASGGAGQAASGSDGAAGSSSHMNGEAGAPNQAQAGGGPAAAAAAGAPSQPPGMSQPPGPSQAPAPNQATGRGAAQQTVSFEERDQVDRSQALRVGDPIEFVLMPGGPGRRPRATQVRNWLEASHHFARDATLSDLAEASSLLGSVWGHQAWGC